MKTLISQLVFIFIFAIHSNAQITAEITNYNCSTNTYDVEFAVTGAQPQMFNDIFWGYDAISQNGYLITDCYDANLVQSPCTCPFVYLPVCACDGRTYGNSCQATSCNGYEPLFEGECDGSELIYFTVHDIPINTGDVIDITSNYLNMNGNTYVYETIMLPIPSNNECSVLPACACAELIDPDVFCTADYNPVCGCDGMTYSNACVAQFGHGITSWTMGECGNTSGGVIYVSCDDGNPNTINDRYDENCNCIGDQISDCACPFLIDNNVFCTAEYDPVCGCDNVTYSNSCVAQYWHGIPSWTLGECGNTSGNEGYVSCDDGDPNTTNDHYDDNCNCVGDPVSSCVCPDVINGNVLCNSVFDPVCGCDGITYSNACVAQYYNGVVAWTPGPCNNTNQDTIYGICDDYNIYTNNDHYNLDCSCSGFLSGCICEDLIDLDAPVPAYFEPVCGCNGVDYGNPDAAQNAGVISWTDGPCTPCASNPITYLWVQTILNDIQSFCNSSSTVKLYTAPYNGDTLIIIIGSHGLDSGLEYIYTCNGQLIQSCPTTIAGYNCELDAGIDINNLNLNQVFDICGQSYVPSTPIIRTCDDGNPATMNDQYDEECNCIGEGMCIDETFPMITICEANLSAYSGPTTDPNNDGVFGWQGGTHWVDGLNVDTIQNGSCTYTQSINIDIIFIGESCDDGNPSTINDVIQADCSCQGINDPCIHITDENFGTFSICNAELGSYNGPHGDPNGDGIIGWQGNNSWINGLNEAIITDANGCTYTQQVTLLIFYVGDSCDDGNPHTANDIIDTDCECRGQLITNCKCADLVDLTTPCSAVYDPVCGCDDVTYSNACVAQFHNGIPSWTPGECDTITSNVVIRALCDDFNDFTSGDYINDSCQCVGYLNACICPDLIDPDRICPAIYDPVCGCDGMTYSNSCVAESHGVINWTVGECKACNDDPMTYIWLQNLVDSLKISFCPASSMEVRITNYNGAPIIIIQAFIGPDFGFDWIFDCKGQMIQNCMITIAGVVCSKSAGIDLGIVSSIKIFDICSGTYSPPTIQYYQCLVAGVPGYYDENCNCVPGTSIVKSELLDFNIYPNPANDYLIVEFEGHATVEIINLSGDILLSTKNKFIDVSNLSSGIYFIKVNNSTKRFIITH